MSDRKYAELLKEITGTWDIYQKLKVVEEMQKYIRTTTNPTQRDFLEGVLRHGNNSGALKDRRISRPYDLAK